MGARTQRCRWPRSCSPGSGHRPGELPRPSKSATYSLIRVGANGSAWNRKMVEVQIQRGALDTLMGEEVQELALSAFLDTRHAKLLKDDGPYGLRCLLVDLNELFKSGKVHCSECQVREKKVTRNGEEKLVKEYYHQAVALVWASGETPWSIGWELLRPGEGELTVGSAWRRFHPKP